MEIPLREVFCLMAIITLAPAGIAAPLGLVINEDNSHFYGVRSADDMTIEGLRAFVDQYAATQVSQLFLCPNAMRASYASDVWDAIWEVGNQKVPAGSPHAVNWVRNAGLLNERGLDPYAVWITRCREKGISPWLSMRMNDVHDVSDPTNFMHNTFWVEHPEYWRVPGSTSGWVDRAYNYGLPQVREHHMKLIRELLERYDPDGLELDWMRFGYHFAPGKEAEGCVLLTAFTREVRALANEWAAKRGHAIKLGARVPAHPDAAKGLGMDGVTWAREGLVDMLVPTPFWTTSDFDIPIELWRDQLGPASDRIVLAAGLESNLRAYPSAGSVGNNLESVRGFATASLHRGADQIYLFNYMDPAPITGGTEAYRTLLEKGLGPEVTDRAPRRHVVTFRDTVPPGISNNAQLPAEGHGKPVFRLYIGPAPKSGRAVFIAGLADRPGVDMAVFDVAVNDASCTQIDDAQSAAPFPGAVRAVQFDCPLAALGDGDNRFRVSQHAGQNEQQIVWAELRVAPGE